MDQNRVTIVAGAAGALGGVVAGVLSAQGHRVAAVGLPRHEERLRALGEGILPLAIEAGDPRAWALALERIERELGPPTGLVSAAGGWRGGKLLHARAPDDEGAWRAMLDANLESAWRALRAVLPGMVARRKGSVVLVGSRAALRPEQGAGAAEYVVAKSAVVALAQTAAAEVREFGVRVNVVLPSTIDTKANRKAMPQADPEKWVSPESLAGVIAFLLSDAARDISGAALPVYGRA